MAEETRTERVDIVPSIDGTQLAGDVQQVDREMDKFVQSLLKAARTNERLQSALKDSGVSVERLSASINNSFGTDVASKYFNQLYASVRAFSEGKLTGGFDSLVAALETANRSLPTNLRHMVMNREELENLVRAYPKLAVQVTDSARAMEIETKAIQERSQALGAAAIATQRAAQLQEQANRSANGSANVQRMNVQQTVADFATNGQGFIPGRGIQAAPSSYGPTAPASQQAYNPSRLADITAAFAAEDAEVRKLAASYDIAGSAARKLAADKAILQAALARGSGDTVVLTTALKNLSDQQEAVTKTGQAGYSQFQRQQILQAGLVNTIQSLAAGQSIFSTLFIQGTQLIGVTGNLNMGFLAVAAGIGIAVAASAGLAIAIARVGDEATMTRARIVALGASTQEAAAIYNRFVSIGANTTGIGANESAAQFARLSIGLREVGASNTEIQRLVVSMQQLGIVGGASTQQINAGLGQFIQAMNKGKLDGDEFKSVFENMPLVIQTIAQAMGVTLGELRKMSEEGRLLGGPVMEAILSRTQAIEQQFSQLPVTMNRGFGMLSASISGILAKLDEAIGLSAALGRAAATAATMIDRARIRSFGTAEEREGLSTREVTGQRDVVTAAERDFQRAAVTTAPPNAAFAAAAERQLRLRGETLERERTRLRELEEVDKTFEPQRAARTEREREEAATALRERRERERQTAAEATADQLGRDTRFRFGSDRERITFNRDDVIRRIGEARPVLEEQRTRLERAVGDAPEGTPQRAAAEEARNKTLERLRELTVGVTAANREYEEALKRLDAPGRRAAAAETRRADGLAKAVQDAETATERLGTSRGARAFINLAGEIAQATREANGNSRATRNNAEAQEALTNLLDRVRQQYSEQTQTLQRANAEVEFKNRVQQLEAIGTRDAITEIDRLTRSRDLEKVALEETNQLRQLRIDLNASERAGTSQLTETIQAQIAEVQSLFNARRDLINDPSTGRMGQQIARDTRSALDSATKLASDFFYDTMSGKVSDIGTKLKETLMRAFSDALANEVFKPLITPLVQSIVPSITGSGGVLGAGLSFLGLGTGAGSGTNLLGQVARGVGRGPEDSTAGLVNQTAGAANSSTPFSSYASLAGSANSSWGLGAFTNSTNLNLPSYLGGNFINPVANSYIVGAPMQGPTLAGAPLANSAGGLTVAGGLGGAASILGGAYGIYSGIKKGGVGGAVGVAGGAAGVLGGVATIAGGVAATGALGAGMAGIAGALSATGPWGMIAAAVLAVVSSMLKGQKASGKGQYSTLDLETGGVEKGGLKGGRFSQENLDAADAAIKSISDLSKSLSTRLGYTPSAVASVGVTQSREGEGGKYYLSINQDKRQFARTEEGAQDMAEAVSSMLLNEFKKVANRATPDIQAIVRNSGTVQLLEENMNWYDQLYKKIAEVDKPVNQFQKGMDDLNAKWQEQINKATELGLGLDKLNDARNKEIGLLQKQRDEQIKSTDLDMHIRESMLRDDGPGAVRALLGANNTRMEENFTKSVTEFRETLRNLGESGSDIDWRAERFDKLQRDEAAKNNKTNFDTIINAIMTRGLRAGGNVKDAELFEFDFNKTREIQNLKTQLTAFQLSEEEINKVILDAENVLGQERLNIIKKYASDIATVDNSISEKSLSEAKERKFRAAQSIIDFLNSQALDAGSSLTKEGKFKEAQRQYQGSLGSKNPDTIVSSAQNYLGASRELFGQGSVSYASIEANTRSQVGTLGQSFATNGTDAALTAQYAELSNILSSQLGELNAQFRAVADELSKINSTRVLA